MNVGKIVIRTMFISGAVCGLAGVIQISGADYTLADSVAGGVGFTAIIVAWISRLNPFVIALVSALFAILEKDAASCSPPSKSPPQPPRCFKASSCSLSLDLNSSPGTLWCSEREAVNNGTTR